MLEAPCDEGSGAGWARGQARSAGVARRTSEVISEQAPEQSVWRPPSINNNIDMSGRAQTDETDNENITDNDTDIDEAHIRLLRKAHAKAAFKTTGKGRRSYFRAFLLKTHGNHKALTRNLKNKYAPAHSDTALGSGDEIEDIEDG